MTQCNISWEQPLMLGGDIHESSMADEQSKLFPANGFSPKDSINHFPPWVSPMGMTDNLNLPWELPAEQIRFCSTSPMNFFGGGSSQQFPASDNRTKDIFFEGSIENGFQDITESHPPIPDKDSGHTNSVSDCSDQIEEDDEQKVVGRQGRKNQSKNLVAERRRRKKLNDRLYTLRSLVPKISKMDRASILGDAIEFVKDLQKKVKDLQDELEEPMEEDGADCNNNNLVPSNQNGPNQEVDESMNKSILGIIDRGKITESAITDDKAPQMEPQVEVTHIGAKEFFLRVLCEQKPGGFVRLMEAMKALGLEVVNVNVITFKKLVLNILKVEKRGDEMVQAEHVRESLLEITRNPIGDWTDTVGASENVSSVDYKQHHPNLGSHLHHFHNQA
ncbi:hypothetical protein NE237_022387 [Protea cynaroides]|uniref:BHLH domain-containing protein n=1 Tax=Protea cynaroides TaxID=273540 RepID=A0A9Q0K5S4_9MAGN|nr:hypothetical protein NE237_022387 [Protea cynaroides]